MMDIRVPEAGESITQVELARWMAADGDYIEKDQEIAEIDSDKATLTINADAAGILKIIIDEGSTIEPGKVIGQIDTSAERKQKPPVQATESQKTNEEAKEEQKDTSSEQQKKSLVAEASIPEPITDDVSPDPKEKLSDNDFTISPQASKLLDEMNVNMDDIDQNPHNKRITKKDILLAIAARANKISTDEGKSFASPPGSREVERIKMTTLRRKIAERLVAVKNETAMLTTFNEVDMSAIMNLRNKYKNKFLEKYGIKPGFMSFFAKAVTLGLLDFPQVNGQLEDGYINIPQYADIGIAVSTPKGLMVPVIRDAQAKSIFELEDAIAQLAKKARENKITIDELTGGTFSITNGGVFGSMLSTPIINPPQSAILGMHNIVDRPVAVDGKVEIRPIMYVALSYDHRVIDGKESVSFLVKVKEYLENPVSMLYPGKDAAEILLGL